MATLNDVIIELKCTHCEMEFKITALELMEAGNEGPPYCECSDDVLDVVNVKL